MIRWELHPSRQILCNPCAIALAGSSCCLCLVSPRLFVIGLVQVYEKCAHCNHRYFGTPLNETLGKKQKLFKPFGNRTPCRRTKANPKNCEKKQCVGKIDPFWTFFSPSRGIGWWWRCACGHAEKRLRDSCIQKSNVHDAVLVGVSTRIPITQDACSTFSQKTLFSL